MTKVDTYLECIKEKEEKNISGLLKLSKNDFFISVKTCCKAYLYELKVNHCELKKNAKLKP